MTPHYRLLIDNKIVCLGTLKECREAATGNWLIQRRATDAPGWIKWDWA